MLWRGGVKLTTGAICWGMGMGSEMMGVVSVGGVKVLTNVVESGVVGELRFMITSAPQHLLYLTCPMIERIRELIPAIMAVMTIGSLIY